MGVIELLSFIFIAEFKGLGRLTWCVHPLTSVLT